MKLPAHLLLAFIPAATALATTPVLFDDQFDLPPGFHIYHAAGPELSGGSYDLCFDGEGRLLVGDGNAVRRLNDRNHDGVFDDYDVIATGLGGRGPQGLLIYGDRLYAVGGDGIQLFEGYRSPDSSGLVHKRRIGNPFRTGGDHDAHTIFRGHDGYLYFMAGNGAGIEDRRHITEKSSPSLFEREASVFRISPDGKKWECLGSGGRNPPSLGMNYLGDLFSFDSDMEWHVGLPWYRPVRLNHWAIGGDQGWQDVGAYPPYYLDCLPGILDVGRGSPTWGVFYEHTQFPEKYHNTFIVCDYRWKRESNDQYHTTGRLVAFFLKRAGAGWTATMEELAKPKPGARDAAGRLINFALVDVEVAPDGSLFVSDHNQGIWRVFYDPNHSVKSSNAPPINPRWPDLSSDPLALVHELLRFPQPASERTRLRQEEIRSRLGIKLEARLQETAVAPKATVPDKLRALRLLTPEFSTLPGNFVSALARDYLPELRGQAAWLLGLRGRPDEIGQLILLLQDEDAFVRRRAVEALSRFQSPAATPALIERLADPERLVRYVAMNALAHRPTSEWFDTTMGQPNPQIRMRALGASLIRREPPSDEAVRRAVQSLLDQEYLFREDRLDLLRILALFQRQIEPDAALGNRVAAHLLNDFPHRERDIRWEQVRLLGAYRIARSFPRLLELLETERDEVTQFHIAQSLSKLANGWTADEEGRLLRWVLSTQQGWFAEFYGKGVEFPRFWATVLSDFAAHHREALLRSLSQINLAGLLGGVVINLLAESPEAEKSLPALYRSNENLEAKLKILGALRRVHAPTVGAFLRLEYAKAPDEKFRAAVLQSLAAHPVDPANLTLLTQGLRHRDPDVVHACADALRQYAPPLTEELARTLVGRLTDRREVFYAAQKLLVALSRQHPPGYRPEAETGRRLEDSVRQAAIAFWKDWFEQRFGKKFELVMAAGAPEKGDDEIHKFILNFDFKTGDAARGARVYETLQCHTCHRGGITPGREGTLFGPDLAGVTRRLSRTELADALVYPSRQVADRFKAFEIQLQDSTLLTGFITGQTDDVITLADREQVHRVSRNNIKSLAPQSASLMPEHLLNRLSWEEIRDLLAFLEDGSINPRATRRDAQ